jgi:hypothetical protein
MDGRNLCLIKKTDSIIPEGADKKDIWERVIVPSVMRKDLNM